MSETETETAPPRRGKNNVDERALETAIASRPPAGDPALSPVELATKRLDSLLADVTDSTIEQLRQLRDQIDDTMRAMLARQTAVREHFVSHVQSATCAMQFKSIASEHLDTVRAKFSEGLELGSTITSTAARG